LVSPDVFRRPCVRTSDAGGQAAFVGWSLPACTPNQTVKQHQRQRRHGDEPTQWRWHVLFPRQVDADVLLVQVPNAISAQCMIPGPVAFNR